LSIIDGNKNVVAIKEGGLDLKELISKPKKELSFDEIELVAKMDDVNDAPSITLKLKFNANA
jgi:hypothetical protein